MPVYRDPNAYYWTVLEAREKAMLIEALQEAAGKVSEVATRLGIARTYVHKRIKHFGLKREDYVGATPEVAGDTPEVADATPEVADATPEVADATPEVADATSHWLYSGVSK